MIIDIVLAFAQGRGGLEDVLTTVSNELVKRGHRVRIFQAYEPNYKEWIETIPEIYFYGIKGNFNEENCDSLIQGYKKMVLEMGIPDVVLATHAPTLSYICRKAFEFLGKSRPNIISWIHGNASYYGNEELLDYADVHFSISTYIGKEISRYVRNDKPIYYIGNPVDIDSFNNIKKIENEMQFVYIGRLSNHEKRLDVMFRALALLNYKWTLKIVGSGEDEAKLKKMAKELKISKNIEWMGWKENPWYYINNATALILTSDVEGFGLVMVEALGRGIPVISSDTAGAIDIVKNGKNGWIFEKGNFKQLTELLEKIKTNTLSVKSEDCIKSVDKFRTKNVIDKIECILENYNTKGSYIKTLNEYKANIKYLIERNFIDEAKYLIQKYVKSIGEDSEICSMKAIIFMFEGNIESAYDVLISGLDLYGNNIDLIFNLAYASYLLGKSEESIKYYNYILIHSEDENLNKEVQENLDKIYGELKDKIKAN